MLPCLHRLNRNSRQNASSTNPSTSTTSSAVEEDNRLGGSIPPFSDENETGDISVIDLVSPHASRLMRRTRTQPLEVDLTCDVDEEVFVVLVKKSYNMCLILYLKLIQEDIVNPHRRDRNLPVTLGASPPSVRPATGRTRRLASQISAGKP